HRLQHSTFRHKPTHLMTALRQCRRGHRSTQRIAKHINTHRYSLAFCASELARKNQSVGAAIRGSEPARERSIRGSELARERSRSDRQIQTLPADKSAFRLQASSHGMLATSQDIVSHSIFLACSLQLAACSFFTFNFHPS